jgi:hypothetical protein
MSRGGDSQDALRAVWMEGYLTAKTQSEAVALLARLVRQAWDRDDALAMRLFGNNTTQMLASDVERMSSGLGWPADCPDCGGNRMHRTECPQALRNECREVLLMVNDWLRSTYTNDQPIHPYAHRVLAEKVQAVLNRLESAS